MAILFDKTKQIGYVVLRVSETSEPIHVNIYAGNCTAVFVHTHDGVDELFWFFASADHLRNIYKCENTVFPFKVSKMVVDYSFPTAPILVKYFTKSNIRVICI